MNIMEMSMRIEALEQANQLRERRINELAQMLTDVLHNRILENNAVMANPVFKLPASKATARKTKRK